MTPPHYGRCTRQLGTGRITTGRESARNVVNQGGSRARGAVAFQPAIAGWVQHQPRGLQRLVSSHFLYRVSNARARIHEVRFIDLRELPLRIGSQPGTALSAVHGPRDDFDIVIVGSGIGDGILADDLGERLGAHKRILVLEAGSFVYPTHVYNLCRFPNSSVARHFGCDTFWQAGSTGGQRRTAG